MVDQADINDWVERFNTALADKTVITAPAPAGATPWYTSFFGCLSPIDTCELPLRIELEPC